MVLTDGSDEAFAGYPTCNAWFVRAMYRRVPAAVRTDRAPHRQRASRFRNRVSFDYKARRFVRRGAGRRGRALLVARHPVGKRQARTLHRVFAEGVVPSTSELYREHFAARHRRSAGAHALCDTLLSRRHADQGGPHVDSRSVRSPSTTRYGAPRASVIDQVSRPAENTSSSRLSAAFARDILGARGGLRVPVSAWLRARRVRARFFNSQRGSNGQFSTVRGAS
jgi:hypothetical protein